LIVGRVCAAFQFNGANAMNSLRNQRRDWAYSLWTNRHHGAILGAVFALFFAFFDLR